MMSIFIQNINYSIISFKNNSLVVRYVLASLVIIGHNALLYGIPEPKLLWGIHSLGWYAVNGFFFLSGILVYQSFLKNNLIEYFIARFLRIMPAYILSLFVALLFVWLFSNIDFNKSTLFQSIRFIFINIIPLSSFNGSMLGSWADNSLNISAWTIPFEVFSYIFIIPLFSKKLTLSIKILLIVISFYFMFQLSIFSGNYYDGLGLRLDYLRVFLYFILGICFYKLFVLRNISYISITIYFSIFVLIYLTEDFYLEFLINILVIFLVFIISFAVKPFLNLNNDYSYGLYIYAWPIQESVALFTNNYFIGIGLVFIITIIISVISWNFVEKKILQKKNELKNLIIKDKNV